MIETEIVKTKSFLTILSFDIIRKRFPTVDRLLNPIVPNSYVDIFYIYNKRTNELVDNNRFFYTLNDAEEYLKEYLRDTHLILKELE